MVLEESNECSVDALSTRKGVIITLWNPYKTPLGNCSPFVLGMPGCNGEGDWGKLPLSFY